MKYLSHLSTVNRRSLQIQTGMGVRVLRTPTPHSQGPCLRWAHFIHDAAYDPELPDVSGCVCVRFGRCDSVTFRWAQPGVKRHSVRPPCYRFYFALCVCVRARPVSLRVYVPTAPGLY